VTEHFANRVRAFVAFITPELCVSGAPHAAGSDAGPYLPMQISDFGLSLFHHILRVVIGVCLLRRLQKGVELLPPLKFRRTSL
jgi:hypothetical protein